MFALRVPHNAHPDGVVKIEGRFVPASAKGCARLVVENSKYYKGGVWIDKSQAFDIGQALLKWAMEETEERK